MVNIRGTSGNIIKIRSRDRSGRLIHSSQISTDDDKAIENEIRTWKDKLGVKLKPLNNIVSNPIDNEEMLNIKKLMQTSINKTNDNMKGYFNNVNNSKKLI